MAIDSKLIINRKHQDMNTNLYFIPVQLKIRSEICNYLKLELQIRSGFINWLKIDYNIQVNLVS